MYSCIKKGICEKDLSSKIYSGRHFYGRFEIRCVYYYNNAMIIFLNYGDLHRTECIHWYVPAYNHQHSISGPIFSNSSSTMLPPSSVTCVKMWLFVLREQRCRRLVWSKNLIKTRISWISGSNQPARFGFMNIYSNYHSDEHDRVQAKQSERKSAAPTRLNFLSVKTLDKSFILWSPWV